jgi:hypothetical protein
MLKIPAEYDRDFVGYIIRHFSPTFSLLCYKMPLLVFADSSGGLIGNDQNSGGDAQ